MNFQDKINLDPDASRQWSMGVRVFAVRQHARHRFEKQLNHNLEGSEDRLNFTRLKV